MKFGVIARADDRGLGNQTWEVARNLPTERVLVVRQPGSEKQGFPPDLDRFPDATIVTDDHGMFDENLTREWLDGLDVVYTAETLYDWRVADWARDLGCATVVHANAEFYRPERGKPEPTEWWAATDWRIDHLHPETHIVPMPVPMDRWPTVNHAAASVLHVGGRAATRDRNGTEFVWGAAAELRETEFVISSQSKIAPPARARKLTNVTIVPPSGAYWDLYPDHAVLLQPRRYGGLCLPANEAAGAGLALVMPDVNPNHWWPITATPARPAPSMSLGPLSIDVHDTNAGACVEALRNVLEDLAAHRARSREWAEAHSWVALAPAWLEHLQRAADAAPHRRKRSIPTPKPRPKTRKLRRREVSLLVPFDPDASIRARNWLWLRRRWETLHPNVEIVEGHHTSPVWVKAEAVADAASRARGDVLIVADADVFTDQAAIEEALALVTHERWVVPHTRVCRLSEVATANYLADSDLDLMSLPIEPGRRPYTGLAGGGIVVLTRDAYQRCPMDDRFQGWGEEDFSWGWALDTLIGPHLRLPADLWHLWHPRQPNHRCPAPASKALSERYRNARGAPRLMQALVNKEPAARAVPLAKPAVFRAGRHSLTIIFGPKRVKFNGGLYQTVDPDLADQLRSRPDIEEVVV